MIKKYKVKIEGAGSYVPIQILTNEDLSKMYNTNESWPEQYLGIKQRHWVTEELSSDLGYKAALSAIENSKLELKDIDLMIVATSSPDKISPSTACIIAEKLKIDCPCFDINSVCTGFLYGLNIAAPLIEAKAYKNILLIATETYSKITDTNSRDCVYFGDGAGAMILTESINGWISTQVYSDGKGKDGFATPIGSTFVMDGKAVFEAGISKLPLAITKILNDANVRLEDIDYLVPHQPGIKMLKTISEKVNFPFEKVITVMDKYANIAAASIPIAFHDAIKSNKIKEGQTILLASIGSGWTWGAGLIKLEK
jgi:3-oxoacyl-[acyl-carrier-protein] synthase-3